MFTFDTLTCEDIKYDEVFTLDHHTIYNFYCIVEMENIIISDKYLHINFFNFRRLRLPHQIIMEELFPNLFLDDNLELLV